MGDHRKEVFELNIQQLRARINRIDDYIIHRQHEIEVLRKKIAHQTDLIKRARRDKERSQGQIEYYKRQ